MKVFFFLFLLLVSFSACRNTSNPPEQQIPLSNTPIEVAQEWVEAFYKDDFSKAVMLGTDITRMMIDSVKKEMQTNAPFIPFTISEMACELSGDSAMCTYIYQEEEDRFDEHVNLINVKGQWLVNESWNNSSEFEEELDLIQKDQEKLLEKEAVFEKE
ncbi:MAG: hypothetical protein ACI8P3_000033 [Saprospiraceae bacterium]|jgi:hypothetical protein